MINLLWLLPVILANRAIGMGLSYRIDPAKATEKDIIIRNEDGSIKEVRRKFSRRLTMPIFCTIIGTCLTQATGREWYWFLIFGALFFVGRTPNVATGLSLATDNPHVQPDRDSWTTSWITKEAIGGTDGYLNTAEWAFWRIFTFYLPLFLAVDYYLGVFAAIIYGICWPLCYRFAG